MFKLKLLGLVQLKDNGMRPLIGRTDTQDVDTRGMNQCPIVGVFRSYKSGCSVLERWVIIN